MDTEVKNFGVRVSASGTRSYFVRVRVGGGRRGQQRRVTISRSDVMTPENARKVARDLLAKARLGQDPGAEKAAKREALTVAELIDEWLEGAGRRNRRGVVRKPYDWRCDRSRLNHHIRPLIGSVRLPDLTKRHIEQVRDDIARGVTARTEKTKARGVSRVRGGEGAATRTLRTLGSVLSYAVDRGYIAHNPRSGVQTTPDQSRERFLSKEELQRLGQTIGSSMADPRALAIIRLWALTGCRHREIAGLKWSQIDLDHGFLRLGLSKGVPRNVFLTPPAVAVIEEVHRVQDTEWVFPATYGGGHYEGTAKVWRDIRKAAGLEGVRPHDLRHTFASQSLAAGASLEVIGALLGHRELRTTRRYAHLAASAVHAAAGRVADVIQGAMEAGRAQTHPDE